MLPAILCSCFFLLCYLLASSSKLFQEPCQQEIILHPQRIDCLLSIQFIDCYCFSRSRSKYLRSLRSARIMLQLPLAGSVALGLSTTVCFDDEGRTPLIKSHRARPVSCISIMTNARHAIEGAVEVVSRQNQLSMGTMHTKVVFFLLPSILLFRYQSSLS